MDNITILGTKTSIPNKPEDAILETFDNKWKESYLVVLDCLEFTSLCPKTGQPDWATLEIIYVPNIKMIESKALKLYLHSFRNHGDFHEDVINRIFDDLWKTMNPKFMRIRGNFNSRGGIAIFPIVRKFNKNCTLEEKDKITEYIVEFDSRK